MEALADTGKGLEVAFDDGLHEEAGLVLGVPLRDIHHERFDDGRPRPPLDDLRMERHDRRVVLRCTGRRRD